MLVGESIRASHETGHTRTCSGQLKVILKGLSQLSIGKVSGDALERMTLGVNVAEKELRSLSELLVLVEHQPQATLKLSTEDHRSVWLTLVPGKPRIVASIQATDNDLLLTTINIMEACCGHDG